jgi:hypothetical protein
MNLLTSPVVAIPTIAATPVNQATEATKDKERNKQEATITSIKKTVKWKKELATTTHQNRMKKKQPTEQPKKSCLRKKQQEFTIGLSYRSLIPQGEPQANNNHIVDLFTLDEAGKVKLIRVKGTINQIQSVKCLIDCGATNNFIAMKLIKQLGLESQIKPSNRLVRGYDGAIKPAAGTITLSFQLGEKGEIEQRKFLITDLSDDIILGMSWFTEINPLINWIKRTIKIKQKQSTEEYILPEIESISQVTSLDSSKLSFPLTDRLLDRLEKNEREKYNQDTITENIQAEVSSEEQCEPEMEERSTTGATLRSKLLEVYSNNNAEKHCRCSTMEVIRTDTSSHTNDHDEENNAAEEVEQSTDVALRKKMLQEYKDVFPSKLPAGLPPSRGHELEIKLKPGSKIPYRQPIRLNLKHEKYQAEWIKEQLAAGAIRPSSSQYAAPHFFVEKPETKTTGVYRAVTDYRRLNDITEKNRNSLPLADDCFNKLVNAKYFSKIDLRTGFYQILVKEADRHKTAFTTNEGLFEYNVLPMGLCNSPAIFMALMRKVFGDYINKFVIVFLDDIIIYSNSLEEHEQHLRLVMQKLRDYKLYAKESKTSLVMREVEFLGHYIGYKGLRVMDDKIKAIKEWPQPKNVREVKAFLGLAGYYRRFVKGFSEIALPMTELTKTVTNKLMEWGVEQQNSFNAVKQALQSAPILILPDTKKPFVVHCDASNYAIGAVLQQDQGNGLQPIAYLSKKLSLAERKYPVHEQELFAIIEALEHWNHHLEGAEHTVTIRTDHKSLTQFQTQPMLSGRQTRWLETLARYDYKIEYVKGIDNNVADGLSRRIDHNDGSSPLERSPGVVDNNKNPTIITLVESHNKLVVECYKILVQQDRSLLAELNAITRSQQGNRQLQRPVNARVSELERAAARKKANEAATQVYQEGTYQPMPRVDQKGVRQTPTQRCTANNKKGNQCGSPTAKGRYCHNHMRILEGVQVKKSPVENAGFGLFATKEFKRGDHIVDYTGDQLSINVRQPNSGGVYCLQLNQRESIDAARTNTGYGRYANDPKGSIAGSPNAEFVLNNRYHTGRLRATKTIRKGEEILVSYGPQYWRTFGPKAKVIVRPAASVERDIIDLTTMQDAELKVVSSEFSSELVNLFKEACEKDKKYVSRILAEEAKEHGEATPSDGLMVRDGRLFTKNNARLCVPDNQQLRTMLIRESHDSPLAGHLGRDKTIELLKRRFFWIGMDSRIAHYVNTCDQCQRNKPSQQREMGLLMPIQSPEESGHTWTMDLITSLPKSNSGNDAIIVFVCKFTKLKHYVACKTAINAVELAKLFMNVIVRQHGLPKCIISDRDPRFTAKFWQAFWKALGTTLNMSTAFQPQSDGQTENSNKTLEIMLRAYINFKQNDWDEHLPAAELAINNAPQTSTGYSPFYLFYGRNATMPLDLALAPLTEAVNNPKAVEELAKWRRAVQQAYENTKTAQVRQKKYADQHRRGVCYKLGDRVLLSTEHLTLKGESKRTRKFTERWIGPFRILERRNANAYKLDLPASMKIHPVFNVNKLKLYQDGVVAFPHRPTSITRPEPIAVEDNGAPVFEVERILDHRRSGRRKVIQYLVKWKGYQIEEATWEPIENCDGALDLIIKYNQEHSVSLNVTTVVYRKKNWGRKKLYYCNRR